MTVKHNLNAHGIDDYVQRDRGTEVVVHQIGDIQIVEYTQNGSLIFQPWLNGDRIGHIYYNLDIAILGALAVKYDGNNSQFPFFAVRMLGIGLEGEIK